MTFPQSQNGSHFVTTERIALLIDGEAYFAAVAAACESARQAIYILGWDVDSRIRLRRGAGAKDETFGEFLDRLVNEQPELHIYILEWDFAMFYSLERETWSRLSLGWMSHERIHFELDDNHPVGACHHQKIVVIDDQLAFVGGFDLASYRWDTSEHRPDHPERCDNGTSYGPVHDVQMLVDGEAAKALGDIARQRWDRATGEQLSAPSTADPVPWPQTISPDHQQLRLAILRTEPDYDGREELREIETFYLDAISQAKSYIYMENQYLSSHAIGTALEKTLRQAQGPEVVMVLPRHCPGWLEEETMGALRNRLHKRLQAADEHGRLRICYPEREGLDTEVIIVHSKILVVDEILMTVGSANLSNRSMGFDTECNLALAAEDREGLAATISGFRNRLLAEHLGCTPDQVAKYLASHGSLIAAIDELGGKQRSLLKLPLQDGESLLEDFSSEIIIDPERPGSVDQLFDIFDSATKRQPEKSQSDFKYKAWRFGAVIVGALLLTALWHWSPLKQWLNLSHLLAAVDYIRASPLAIPLVLGIYAVGSCLMFPVNLLILATALSFGSVTGFAVALSGSLLGGAASYLLGHWLGHDVVSRLAGEKLNRLSRKLARRGWLAVALVRVIPIAPYTLVNMVAGASHISAKSFLVGTAVGMCPGIVAIMIFEEGLERLLRDPHWGTALLAFFALGCAAIVIYFGKSWLTRRERRRDD
jgi:phosphatidylserine/phosphatidylglycerophosphate/cardiolipin synthase-like enzyme/uncharacterized membrane protein YdjX (TVP38/TMEM64 family)